MIISRYLFTKQVLPNFNPGKRVDAGQRANVIMQNRSNFKVFQPILESFQIELVTLNANINTKSQYTTFNSILLILTIKLMTFDFEYILLKVRIYRNRPLYRI